MSRLTCYLRRVRQERYPEELAESRKFSLHYKVSKDRRGSAMTWGMRVEVWEEGGELKAASYLLALPEQG